MKPSQEKYPGRHTKSFQKVKLLLQYSLKTPSDA
jgi:hypothetical protein